MKRITILLALLLLVVAGCASQTGSSVEASESATEEATPEPTPTEEATEAPESSDGGSSGDGTALTDILPDELGGNSRTDIPGLEAMLAPMLAQSGADVTAADFAFASYGEGGGVLQVQAFRIPGMGEVELEGLARAMAGANAGGELESTTVSGKSVLQMAATGTPGVVYLYFGDEAVFTIISEDADLAAQLLAELP